MTLAGAHQVLLQDAYRWVANERASGCQPATDCLVESGQPGPLRTCEFGPCRPLFDACAGKDVSLCGTRCLEAAIHCAALHCAHQRQSEGAGHSAPHQSMPPSCPLPARTQQEPQQQHQEPQQQQQQQEQGHLQQQGPLHPSGTQSQQPDVTTEARQLGNSSKNLLGAWQRLSWLSRLTRRLIKLADL